MSPTYGDTIQEISDLYDKIFYSICITTDQISYKQNKISKRF